MKFGDYELAVGKKEKYLVVVITIFAIGIIYLLFARQLPTYPSCAYTPDTGFTLCSYDKSQNKMIPYVDVDLTNFSSGKGATLFDSSLWPSLKAGDYVEYFLNFSKIELPSSYYLCTHGILLEKLNRDADFLTLTDINPDTNNDFACNSQPLTSSSNKIIRASGFVPCMNDEVSLIELYVFPNNFTATNINQFEDSISGGNMIFGVYGEIKC